MWKKKHLDAYFVATSQTWNIIYLLLFNVIYYMYIVNNFTIVLISVYLYQFM